MNFVLKKKVTKLLWINYAEKLRVQRSNLEIIIDRLFKINKILLKKQI